MSSDQRPNNGSTSERKMNVTGNQVRSHEKFFCRLAEAQSEKSAEIEKKRQHYEGKKNFLRSEEWRLKTEVTCNDNLRAHLNTELNELKKYERQHVAALKAEVRQLRLTNKSLKEKRNEEFDRLKIMKHVYESFTNLMTVGTKSTDNHNYTIAQSQAEHSTLLFSEDDTQSQSAIFFESMIQ